MNERDLRELLDKYNRNKVTAGERQLVEAWYSELQEGEDHFLSSDSNFKTYAENRLRSELPGLQPVASIPTQLSPLRKINGIYKWSAAAAIAGILLIVTFFKLSQHTPAVVATVSVIQSNRNEIKRFKLSDGSMVVLNRLSRLEWKNDPESKTREVVLSGEAYFDIHPDAARPFKVRTERTVTEVLGTVFNVEAYQGEQEVKVALLSGSVRFNSKGMLQQPSLLKPGSMIRYSNVSGTYTVGAVQNKVHKWTDGSIVLDEVPLKDAIERIALFGGWKTKWKDETSYKPERTISAEFNHETPGQMLESISFSHQLKYKITRDSLIIY